MNVPKISIGINNPFSTQYQQFSDRKLPLKENAPF